VADQVVPQGIEAYAYDPEKAKKLLEEAGWDKINGNKPITLLTYYTTPLAANVMAAVQAMLAQVGINVTPRAVDTPTYNSIVLNPTPDVAQFQMVYAGLQNGPDPSSINVGLNEKQIPPAGPNVVRARMPELTKALDTALGETDATKRDARYQDVCKVMNAELPWGTLWVANRYGVASAKLKDFVWTPAPGGGPYQAHPENGRSPNRAAPLLRNEGWPALARHPHRNTSMLKYSLRRLLIGAGMLLALSMLIFVMLRLTPGDPIDAYIDPNVPMSPSDLVELRATLGLDQPLPVQYLAWLQQALTGNLGYSIQRPDQAVLGLVVSRVGPTVLLMGTAIVIAIIAGIATGIVSAVRRNSLADISFSVLAVTGISSPPFLSGLVGLYLFSVYFNWMPSGGMLTPGREFSLLDLIHHLILPASLLALAQTALIMRYMRGSMLEVLNLDYVRTARAKGVSEFWVITKHALRNALLPVITLIGSTIGLAIGGAIFIESVFNWPGMGLLMVTAVENRDYPVIMGSTLVIGACVIVVNLMTDLAYAAVDPRIKVG
jgi:peptide/nickel transport system permease protein